MRSTERCNALGNNYRYILQLFFTCRGKIVAAEFEVAETIPDDENTSLDGYRAYQSEWKY